MATVPNVGDGIQFLLFQPWKTTLYGMAETPEYWLRVVPNGSFGGKTFTRDVKSRGTDGSVVVSDVVTTMDMKQFLLAMSFGSTPHIETAITTIDELNGLRDIYGEPKPFMTQAMLRSYESRLMTLVDVAEDKAHSLMRNKDVTRSLVGEMHGVKILWNQLMNTGMISPCNCLMTERECGRFDGSLSDYVTETKEDMKQLRSRLYYGNFVDMPYKSEQYQRDNLLESYGIR